MHTVNQQNRQKNSTALKDGIFRLGQWFIYWLFWIGMVWAALAQGTGVTTTTVQDTVYLANGRPASGTVQISWPSFTTASGNAVAAGSTSVTLGADGFFSANLAPNAGSTPSGLYYTVTYNLSDGSAHNEYWPPPVSSSPSCKSPSKPGTATEFLFFEKSPQNLCFCKSAANIGITKPVVILSEVSRLA